MGQRPDIVCFTCGKATGEEPRLNTLPSGELCPTCRNRVLDALPPLLPNRDEPETDAPEELEETAFIQFPEIVREEPDDPIGA